MEEKKPKSTNPAEEDLLKALLEDVGSFSDSTNSAESADNESDEDSHVSENINDSEKIDVWGLPENLFSPDSLENSKVDVKEPFDGPVTDEPATSDDFIDQINLKMSIDDHDNNMQDQDEVNHEGLNNNNIEMQKPPSHTALKRKFSDAIELPEPEPEPELNSPASALAPTSPPSSTLPTVDATEVMDSGKVEQHPALPMSFEDTIAVTRFARRQKKNLDPNYSRTDIDKKENKKESSDLENSHIRENDKVYISYQKLGKFNSSQVSIDASLAQADNLRLAQNRILELEKEVDNIRQENDELLTASDIIRNKTEEYALKISALEKENSENTSDLKNQIGILKGNLSFKEHEVNQLKNKIEELEFRLKNDFKKIRVRERELENRLELVRAEKQAVVKSKDELLLQTQRKLDQSKSEQESYRNKVQELNKVIENYQNQIKMTVRALRLALSHVEDRVDNNSVKYKKAE